jgi:hypothetical protein
LRAARALRGGQPIGFARSVQSTHVSSLRARVDFVVSAPAAGIHGGLLGG